jgi:hypothetical protein
MTEKGEHVNDAGDDPEALKARVSELERRLEESTAFGIATAGSLLEAIMVVESLVRRLERLSPSAGRSREDADQDVTPDQKVLERAWDRTFKQFEKFENAG